MAAGSPLASLALWSITDFQRGFDTANAGLILTVAFHAAANGEHCGSGVPMLCGVIRGLDNSLSGGQGKPRQIGEHDVPIRINGERARIKFPAQS